jgi:hypothetical protein
MATTSLFDKMRKGMTAEANTNASRKWFADKVRGLKGNINSMQMLKDPHFIRKTTFRPGFMYHFIYDALHKETLPYFDRFPLIVAVAPAEGGFYGMNLHYVAPVPRARLLDSLLLTTNNENYDETTKFRINYNILNSAAKFRWFRPCFKRYLFSQVESKIMLVPSSEWEIAIFLPTEKFVGANKTKVWRESKKMVTGYRA